LENDQTTVVVQVSRVKIGLFVDFVEINKVFDSVKRCGPISLAVPKLVGFGQHRVDGLLDIRSWGVGKIVLYALSVR
jgi:hypothetical protein